MKSKFMLLILSLAALATSVSHAQSLLGGWGYLNSFPWVYVNDEESWAYIYPDDGYYWAYVLESGDTLFAGYLGGDAPLSVAGKTTVYQRKLPSGTFTTETIVYTDTEFTSVIPDGEHEIITRGTYDYSQLGPDIGVVQFTPNVGSDSITDFLIFEDTNGGYYISLIYQGDEPPTADNNGGYGDMTISDTIEALQ